MVSVDTAHKGASGAILGPPTNQAEAVRRVPLTLETMAMPEDWSAWATAERLARRIYELTTVPMRSENHPTWDPTWRAAINNGLRAIGTGDEATMEQALHEINRLTETL